MSRNERDQTDESQVDLVGQRRPPEHLLAAATAALQADPNVGVVAVNGSAYASRFLLRCAFRRAANSPATPRGSTSSSPKI